LGPTAVDQAALVKLGRGLYLFEWIYKLQNEQKEHFLSTNSNERRCFEACSVPKNASIFLDKTEQIL